MYQLIDYLLSSNASNMVKNNPILVKTLQMETKFAEEFVQPEQACIVCEEGYFGQKIGKFTKVNLANIFKVEINSLKKCNFFST